MSTGGVKITWALSTPIVWPDHELHLDALVAWAAVQEALEHGQDPRVARLHLPLEQVEEGGERIWKASQIRFPEYSSFTEIWTRQINYWEGASDKGDVWSGRTKTYSGAMRGTGKHKPYKDSRLRAWAPFAEAWAITTDTDRLKQLLSRVSSIGPERRLGAGRVASMKIEEDPDAEHLWMHRHMAEPREGYAKTVGNLSDPYWNKTTMRKVYAPLSNWHGVVDNG